MEVLATQRLHKRCEAVAGPRLQTGYSSTTLKLGPPFTTTVHLQALTDEPCSSPACPASSSACRPTS
eukprot:459290-Heterocapsa_arctica.AAC.1